MRYWTPTLVLAAGFGLALCGSAAAQEEKESHLQEEQDKVLEEEQEKISAQDELAKAVQNPLATLMSVPFQANFNQGVGEHDRRMFNLNIQPVIPFPGEKWNIISRTIIPVNSVPVGETDSVFGIGDTSLSVFWSPASTGALTWGIGPALSLPTASNPEVLGSGQFSLGPTGVLFYGIGKWTMGAVAATCGRSPETATAPTSISSSPSIS